MKEKEGYQFSVSPHTFRSLSCTPGFQQRFLLPSTLLYRRCYLKNSLNRYYVGNEDKTPTFFEGSNFVSRHAHLMLSFFTKFEKFSLIPKSNLWLVELNSLLRTEVNWLAHVQLRFSFELNLLCSTLIQRCLIIRVKKSWDLQSQTFKIFKIVHHKWNAFLTSDWCAAFN